MRKKIRTVLGRINFPLLLGSIIVILFTIICFYPQWFTDKDPVWEEPPKYIEMEVEGEVVEKFMNNPMPPNKENIMGTDDAGRDIYSRLVYGARNTLKLALLVTVFRMLLAIPLGMAAGMGTKFISNIIKVFNTIFTAIPMMIFCFVVLNRSYFRNLRMDKAIWVFAIVFTIIGWAKVAGIIEDVTRLTMDEDFIEGEIAIGKTRLQIAYQNILPHIIPASISLFFKEMGMVLFLLAQLAVINVFVGLTRSIQSLAFRANYEMGLEPEWGNILSRISQNTRAYSAVYWMTVYPIFIFAMAIMGLNLTGEGLRIEFQKRNSRVISYIKKLGYILSPRVFIAQVKNIRVYYKPVILKISVVVIIIAINVVQWHPSLYEFDITEAEMHLEELTSEKYGGRVAGSEGGAAAGQYIIDTLKAYGYQVDIEEVPMDYTAINHETNMTETSMAFLTPTIVEEGQINLITEGGKEKIYELHKDFTIGTVKNWNLKVNSEGKVVYEGIAADKANADKVPQSVDIFPIQVPKKDEVLDDGIYGYLYPGENRYYDPEVDIQEWLEEQVTDREYQVVFKLIEEYNVKNNAYASEVTTIIPYENLRKELEKGYKQLEISFDKPREAQFQGRNINALILGKDKTSDKPGEIVTIGATYDGVYVKEGGKSPVMSATPAAIALELARQISLLEEPLDKTIKFVFWDNEWDSMKFSQSNGALYHSLVEQKDYELFNSNKYYYIDISYPGVKGDRKMYLTSHPASVRDEVNYTMTMDIEKRLKQLDVNYERLHHSYKSTKAVDSLKKYSLTTIGVGNPDTAGINSSKDTFENINYKRMEDMGQIILDILTMNPYLMNEE